MASDSGVPGAGVLGELPPSFARSRPAADADALRGPSGYCHAAFALKHISKVITQDLVLKGRFYCFGAGVVFFFLKGEYVVFYWGVPKPTSKKSLVWMTRFGFFSVLGV